MKKLAFISSLFAAVFMFLALGSTKAKAFGNCEDRIFPSGPVAGYFCHETDQDALNTEEYCTFFDQGGPLSFQWVLDNEFTLDCQCRKTLLNFETHPYEFLCAGIEDEDEAVGFIGKISWKGGPILAEGVEVEGDDPDESGGSLLKCRPDPSCVPPPP
jgi:hypothetical protein